MHSGYFGKEIYLFQEIIISNVNKFYVLLFLNNKKYEWALKETAPTIRNHWSSSDGSRSSSV